MIYACFYVSYPYYFPHFLPISQKLQAMGHKVHYVLSNEKNTQLIEKIAKQNGLDYSLGENQLRNIECQYVFFANQNSVARELKAKTIFLEHGIGSKSMRFYSAIEYFDIYLVEGKHKFQRLSELYPEHKHKLRKVGFSKFDAILNMTEAQIKEQREKYGFSDNKKTILYAPTFFPSSIEKMSDGFPYDFAEQNILIKAHYLTYERKQYKKQRDKLSRWAEAPNCHVVGVDEYNIVPLFAISDVMISDESSAMFEFASLNRPVISNRYVKLRFSYYLMPWKLNKRIDKSKDKYRDILYNANSYKETVSYTQRALENPQEQEALRLAFAGDICGTIDGQVSNRIMNVLENEIS